MQIVIDGRMILPQMSGVGRYLLGLSTGLRTLKGDLEYELWLQDSLPAQHPAWRLSSPNFRVQRIPARQMSIAAQWYVPFALNRSKPALFHYPHFDLPFLSPGKIVVTIHDLKYLDRPDFFPTKSRLKRHIINISMRFACHRASQIICVSAFTAQKLNQLLSIPPEKIRVIPHGVDSHFFEPGNPPEISEVRKKNELDKPFLLYVGERRPHKNIPGLIMAFKYFLELTREDYQLVIVGKPYRDYRLPEEITLKLRLSERVRFLNTVNEQELKILYHSAEAMVLLSFAEGFGLPVLEAMACGTPVVISDCASLPEIAGSAARIVPPDNPQLAAEAIVKVISGGELRQVSIQRGLERARQFSWDRCAAQTAQVYRDTLKQ